MKTHKCISASCQHRTSCIFGLLQSVNPNTSQTTNTVISFSKTQFIQYWKHSGIAFVNENIHVKTHAIVSALFNGQPIALPSSPGCGTALAPLFSWDLPPAIKTRKSLYQGFRWIGGSFQFELLVIYSSIYIHLRHVPFYFYACILPHFATFACVPGPFQGRVLRRLLVHLCLTTNPLEAMNKWNARLTKRAAQYQLYHIDDIDSYCI